MNWTVIVPICAVHCGVGFLLARLVQAQLRFENRYSWAKQDFLAASVVFFWPIYLAAAVSMEGVRLIKKGFTRE